MTLKEFLKSDYEIIQILDNGKCNGQMIILKEVDC